jgi:hypothetical protein
MSTTYTHRNPSWWTNENDSSWDRVKEAMKRDWDQTKHDFGGNEPDTNQKIGNTVRQAEGKEAIPPRRVSTYDEIEPASRFGYGAHSRYGKQHPTWDAKLEAELRSEWEKLEPNRKSNWTQDRDAIHYGWEYEE